MTEVIQVFEGHDIDKPLEVDGLVPFKTSVGMVFGKHIRHVILDKALDLFKDIWNKALLVFKQKWFQLFLIWAEATDFIKLVSKPFDGFLSLAEFDG